MRDEYTYKGDTFLPPNTITFGIHGKTIMTITPESITTAEDIDVDEASREIFNTLEGYIKEMVENYSRGKKT